MSDWAAPQGPLVGVRVLELALGRVARIAGMLLADLGADVVSIAPESPETPETVCWDRGKRRAAGAEITPLAARADVILVDAGPAQLAARSWSSDSLRAVAPQAVHVWLPPYAEQGEWCDLPEDPLVLAALGILAVYLPADDLSPVAPILSTITYLQAGIGAAAAVAGLVGRERQGVAQPVVVSGLHAAAALMGPSISEINDGPSFAPSRAIKGNPNWRIYPCADGRGIFLATLTPDLFFRALDALDRMDVMAMPEVAGDFTSVLDLKRGRLAVSAELEPIFAARPSEEWVTLLREHRVPCAVVQSRADWMAGPIVAANGTRLEMEHPQFGSVTMPNVAIEFSETPGAVRGLRVDVAADADLWPGVASVASGPEVDALPLAGLRVIDSSSYLGGPMIATLMADFGADVVRVEPPHGDGYRQYPLAFLAVNQRKEGIVLDIKQAADRQALHALLADTDVLVENLRPSALATIGLGGAEEQERYPGLVHCSVSAFGRDERFAEWPGFDPILQSLTGMAIAQGGADDPATCSPGVNDVAMGSLGAVGTLAALYRRLRVGHGQRLWVSLAASCTYMQSGEFTTWAGSPPPPQGARLYRGPDEGHRYHECSDGWVAVAAITPAERGRLCAALDVADLSGVAGALRVLTVAQACAVLAAAGVTAARVVPRTRGLHDPFLVANGFSHLVEVPEGQARVVNHHSRWVLAPEPRPGRYFDVGASTEAVLRLADR